MGKKKKLTYYERMEDALKSLPCPLEDKRHNLYIYFVNDQARTNQTRYEHIIQKRHNLTSSDIRRIVKGIKTCIFRKDPERSDTYNIYIKRYSFSQEEYIKISLHIDPRKPKRGLVKTMYITKDIK